MKIGDKLSIIQLRDGRQVIGPYNIESHKKFPYQKTDDPYKFIGNLVVKTLKPADVLKEDLIINHNYYLIFTTHRGNYFVYAVWNGFVFYPKHLPGFGLYGQQKGHREHYTFEDCIQVVNRPLSWMVIL